MRDTSTLPVSQAERNKTSELGPALVSGGFSRMRLARMRAALRRHVDCGVLPGFVALVHHRDRTHVETYGTGRLPEDKMVSLIREHFDLTPKGIIETLNLRRPIYKQTAAFGHFGRRLPEFTWESTDRAEALAKAAGVEMAAPVGTGS